jgi:RNA polymerase sigma-70 factor (ECF subfamily)
MRIDCLLSPPVLMPLDLDADQADPRPALDRFLREVERRALRQAELSCGSREDALELVQEAMFGFVRSYAGKPRAEWRLLFWRVLDSRLADFQRRRRVRSRWQVWLRGGDAEDEEPLARVPDLAEPGPLGRLADAEAMRALERALRALPRRQREVTALRYYLGLDVAAIAAWLGIGEGTVKAQLFRARQALAAVLRDDLDDDPEDDRAG